MPGNQSDPLTFMTAVAARTQTLRVGTGIFQLPIHHPLRVAEQVATIDQISAGRVSLGVGSGWWPLEYDAHGSCFRQRGSRMEEALQILKRVWTQENTSFEGRHYRFAALTLHPRPVQKPHPPLWVAGVADAAVDRAARLGDAWLCGPVQSLAKAQACLGVYRDACARHRTRPEWILRRYAWIAPTRREVEEAILPGYVDGLMKHWRESVEDAEEKRLFARIDAGEPVSAQEIARDRLLWGSPDDFIAQIERYRAATGCEHVHTAFGAGLPARSSESSTYGSFEAHATMIRLFGAAVVPAFER
jgi:probable F420-dependent oxidoreductase